jgi:hypothetical protein
LRPGAGFVSALPPAAGLGSLVAAPSNDPGAAFRTNRYFRYVLVLMFAGASLQHLDPAVPFLGQGQAPVRLACLGTALLLLIPAAATIGAIAISRAGQALVSVWALFGAAVGVSCAVNNDSPEALASCLWMMIGVPLVFFVILPNILMPGQDRILTDALFFSYLPLPLISLCLDRDLHFMYKGIFIHPNTLGVIGCILLTCLWTYVMAHTRQPKSQKRLFFLVGMMGLCFWVIFVSGSRTSLLSAAVTSLSALFLMTGRRKKTLVVAMVFAGGLAAVLLHMTQAGETIMEALVNKQFIQSMHGDALSGRTAIWTAALADREILGHGAGYFESVIGMSSHNSLMRVLGERGMVAAVLLACFGLLSIICSYRYATRAFKEDPYAAGPFLTVLSFWTLSFGEGLFSSFGTGITLALFLSVGMIVRGRVLRPGLPDHVE